MPPTGCFANHRLRGLDSARVHGDGRTAEVIAEQEAEGSIGADGDAVINSEAISLNLHSHMGACGGLQESGVVHPQWRRLFANVQACNA
jgi:hypothetical protein